MIRKKDVRKSDVRKNDIRKNDRVRQEYRIGKKHRSGQMLGTWCCVLAVCLGILFPQIETAAATDAQVALQVAQTLDIGDTVLSDKEQEFNYLLEAIERSNPLPQGNEEHTYFFTLKGNQSMTLAPLTFTTVGEYQYRLQLVGNESDKEFIYDTEVYEITVFVTERGGSLSADVIAVNKAGFKNEVLHFTHGYEEIASPPPNIVEPNPRPDVKEPNPPLQTPTTPSDFGNQTGKLAPGIKTGDIASVSLFVGTASVALLVIFVMLTMRKKSKMHERYRI